MSNKNKLRGLFIGSSREALPIARKVKTLIESEFNNTIKVQVWDKTKWKNLTSALENVTNNVDEFYYAVFIGYPDDIIHYRNRNYYTSRDNVIFELGLFLTRLGKDRTFFAVPGKLDYKGQMPFQLKKRNLKNNLGYKLITDIGKNRMGYKINFEYKHAKDPKNEKLEIDTWEAKTLKSDLRELFIDLKKEEDKHKNSRINSEEELTSRGVSLVKEIKLNQKESNEFFIHKLINELPTLIYARSRASTKPVIDTTIDIVELIYKFKDFLDVEQLIKKQHYSSVKKVWIFADSPIEFDMGTKEEKRKLLQKTILKNIQKGVEYTYIVNRKFKIDSIDSLFDGLSAINKEKYRRKIKVVRIESKHFKTFFTLHFSKKESQQPNSIYMSALLPERDDLLIQIAENPHYERIFERIKKIVGHIDTTNSYKVIDHVIQD